MSKVKLYKVESRIHAEIPYQGGAGPAQAKRVSGARPKYENRDGRRVFVAWTYPLSMDVCRQLRAEFGNRLQIHQDLADWARAERDAEEAQLKLRSARDADLRLVPDVAPKLAEAMSKRTYQRVGARFIADGRNVLIADEPGLGKTLEALGAVIETGARLVLVLAKKKAIETVWVPEIKRWLGDIAEVHPLTGTGKERQLKLHKMDLRAEEYSQDGKIHFVIGNIEMVRWPKGGSPKFPLLFHWVWDAIIVDESHKALIGKNVMSNNITQTRYGMMKLKSHANAIKVALSGTPFRGKPDNLWGTLNWLRPDLYTGYWRFVERFFEVDDNRWGKKVGGLRPEKIEEFDQTLAPIMLRRTKEEVAPDMPPRQYGGSPLDPANPATTIGVWLDMEPAQAKNYQAIAASGETRLKSGMLTANGHLAELTRLKQFASCNWDIEATESQTLVTPQAPSNKYNWILEFVGERQSAGQKVVVASQFTKLLNAFSAWLAGDGIKSYVLSGETSPDAAMDIVAAFNDPADDTPVCLINTMAGGESINLDACADDVVFVDETFIPDDQEQVENRIHRMSRIHQVNVWYLRSRGTVDEDICKITGAREGAVKARLDGSRGVEIARKILKG